MAMVDQFLRFFKKNFSVNKIYDWGLVIPFHLKAGSYKSWSLKQIQFLTWHPYLPFVDDDIDSVNAVGVEFDDMVKQTTSTPSDTLSSKTSTVTTPTAAA